MSAPGQAYSSRPRPSPVTVGAAAESLTVFLKGYHPFAVQGGATLFDNVRVVDLGE